MQTTAENIEDQMKAYGIDFLKAEYGDEAARKLEMMEIKVIDAYDIGGISEITDKVIKIAAKRDIDAGKLTNTTKLIIRHELGHLLDENSPDFPEFEEQIEHERIAWTNAKPKNSAEYWYKNISIRTHMDPLKMQSMGFPRPETKITSDRLEQGICLELIRMKKDSPIADENLAKRYAMANLVENLDYYSNKFF